jgi:cob(I)alamin adenosyltransferase
MHEMATRLSVITTRTGDSGTTGLGDGTRVGKDEPRIQAIGDVDELNSAIGLLRAESLPDDVDAVLRRIQNQLFDLGAELCIPGHQAISDRHVQYLEGRIGHYNGSLPKLAEFILPGGCRAAALSHQARTVCRRAERSVVALGRQQTINPPVRQYLNRLSDLCFILSRILNQAAGCPDVLWSREPKEDDMSP